MTKAQEVDDFDYAAALQAPSMREGHTLAGRRESEKKRMSRADRLRLQTTGRTEQFNIRVTPMRKVEFGQQAERRGLKPAELFEDVVDHWNRTLGNPEFQKRAAALGMSCETLMGQIVEREIAKGAQ